jgi:hypothetical protein
MSRLLAFWLDHGDPWVQEWRWTRAALAALLPVPAEGAKGGG